MKKTKLTIEKSLFELCDELSGLDPDLVEKFSPEKSIADEQKRKFLNNEIVNPKNYYPAIEDYNYSDQISKVNQAGYCLLELDDKLDLRLAPNCNEAISEITKKSQVLEIARLYSGTDNDFEKRQLAEQYVMINSELYGGIDEATYRAMLQKKLNKINSNIYHGQATTIRNELFSLTNYDSHIENVKTYKPPDETVKWLGDVVNFYYGGMLKHIPDQDQFSPEEIKAIFSEIINDEFGEMADGWQVELGQAVSVKVSYSSKTVIVPFDREPVDYLKMKKLVVHELGVHVFRRIMSFEVNMPSLLAKRGGLSVEEGLTTVLEQVLSGKYSEGGVEAYISTGLISFDNCDFRKAFEIKWRLKALSLAKKSGDIDTGILDKAKNLAYKSMFRCLRGTDELPFLKDLAYYNGSVAMWKYLEEIRGNDAEFMLFFAGRTIPDIANNTRIS